jgi:hypothetical protein
LRVVAETCGLVRDTLVGINSEVSYQLDHAPAGDARTEVLATRVGAVFTEKVPRSIFLRYHEDCIGPTTMSAKFAREIQNDCVAAMAEFIYIEVNEVDGKNGCKEE